MKAASVSKAASTRPARRGRSAVELAVCGAIAALGATLLLPALYGAALEAKTRTCENNLKRLGTAIESFEQAQRHLPGAWYHPGDAAGSAAYAGGFTQLLPHVNQQALYAKYDFAKHWWDPANQEVAKTRIPLFECPDAPGAHVRKGLRGIGGGDKVDESLSAAVGDYWILRGFIEDRVPRVDGRTPGALMPLSADGAAQKAHDVLPRWELITDGRASSLMLGEKGGAPDFFIRGVKQEKPANFNGFNDPWTSYSSAWVRVYTADGTKENWTAGPCAVNCQNGYGAVYAFHQGGANFLFADGSVKFVHEKLAPDVYLSLLSRSGGEVVSPDDL